MYRWLLALPFIETVITKMQLINSIKYKLINAYCLCCTITITIQPIPASSRLYIEKTWCKPHRTVTAIVVTVNSLKQGLLEFVSSNELHSYLQVCVKCFLRPFKLLHKYFERVQSLKTALHTATALTRERGRGREREGWREREREGGRKREEEREIEEREVHLMISCWIL